MNIDLKHLCQFYLDNCDTIIDKYRSKNTMEDNVSYDELIFIKTRCRAELTNNDWNIRKELKDKMIDFLIEFESNPSIDYKQMIG